MNLLAITSTQTLLGVLIYVVGLILSVVVVARLLTGTKSPATTMLWVLVIVAAPYVGVLFYYLLPHRIQMARLRRRARKLATHTRSLHPCDDDAGTDPEDPMLDFLRRIDRMSVTECNRVRILETGPEFFEDVLEQIENAQHFVHVEMYIFRPDETGQRLLAALTEAARRGVEVRLLYDHLGSWSLKQRHLHELVASGGKAVSFMPLLWRRRPFNLNLRNHRKLIFVDGDIAFLGGRNVGDEYGFDRFKGGKQWFDLMLSVRGPGVIPLHEIFVEDWFNARDEKLVARKYFPDPPDQGEDGEPFGRTSLGIVASGPDRAGKSFRHVLFEMIGRARERIEISSPYLVPHPAIDAALTAAAIRGVRIRLHCNGPGAAEFVLYHAARSQYARLLDRGVEVIESDGDYNHSKMYVVDDRYVLLGSGNLDMRSFELNFEVGTLIVDRVLCAQCSDLFEKRANYGRRVTRADLEISSLGRLLDGVCRLFSPIL
ncbi:MAG: cardiolipin synthase [Planctomycetes bacterium]|nr:cardiolipin synthase [Planctomycetota bacterium]MCB9891104.1 cardiolipin synthase [Planctomycetota bacterium]MCB9918872.1 cardiolipin synthase [Planctomycetota bacterium]